MTTDAILAIGAFFFVLGVAYITATAWLAFIDCLQALTRLADAVTDVVRRDD